MYTRLDGWWIEINLVKWMDDSYSDDGWMFR